MSRDNYEKCVLGNDMQFVDELINNMLETLVYQASDNFWKILKYGTTDATTDVSKTITTQDKLDIIKRGHSSRRIKTLKFNNDISETAHTEVRFFNGAWQTPTLGNYNVIIGIEIISHNDIIELDNGDTTLNYLRHEIYRVFNNAYVFRGVGKFTSEGISGALVIFNNLYQGYQFGLRSLSM